MPAYQKRVGQMRRLRQKIERLSSANRHVDAICGLAQTLRVCKRERQETRGAS